MLKIQTKSVSVTVSDGTEMKIFIAHPSRGSLSPGLILLQEAFGVNAHIRNIAERLAREGYVTAAPELFHRTAPPGFESSYEDFTSVAPHLKAMTQESLKTDLFATYEWLRNDFGVLADKVGSIGFCMGGRVSYLANAFLPLGASVSFYGGGISPALLSCAHDQHGPILLFWGGKDRHIGPEQQRAVADSLRRAEKIFVDVEFSDAEHGFFCDQRKSYHRLAARQSWALTLEFLKSYL